MTRRPFKKIYQVGDTAESGCTPQNEIQNVHMIGPPTGGTFTMTISGDTTTSLAYDISNASLVTEIESLAPFISGDITVTGGFPGGVAIEFGGSRKETQIDIITCNVNGLEGLGIGMIVIANQRGRNG